MQQENYFILPAFYIARATKPAHRQTEKAPSKYLRIFAKFDRRQTVQAKISKKETKLCRNPRKDHAEAIRSVKGTEQYKQKGH